MSTITLAVKPGSKRPGLAREGDAWLLRVRERAVDGAANEACVRALAHALDLPPSRVELVRGQRGRTKTFAVALDRGTITERLNAAADKGATA